jgi:hypothetical protein
MHFNCNLVTILRRNLTIGVLAATIAAIIPACAAAPGDDSEQPATTGAAAAADPVNGASAASLEVPDSEFVSTPVGQFHRSCVHTVADGATVEASGRVTLRSGETTQLPACGFQPRDDRRTSLALNQRVASPGHAHADAMGPTVNGWAEADVGFAPTNGSGFSWFNELDGTWTVPAAPKQYTQQTIYLFPSLESSSNEIIQPVLQYGPSPDGGGQNWAIAVWYVIGSNTVAVSPLTAVSVGDTIEGFMSAHDCTSDGVCSWALSVWDGSRGNALNVMPSGVFDYAQKGVLETYGVTNCNKLPTEGDTGASFTNVHAYMPGPATTNFNDATTSVSWSGPVWASGCSFGVIDQPFGADLFWD